MPTIKGMRLYLAGAEGTIWMRVIGEVHPYGLMSYHSFTKTDSRREEFFQETDQVIRELILDSGAFSAFTKGIEIPIDEYANFLDRYGNHFIRYANLDSIGDPAKTMENQMELERMGFSPLPVFHQGSDFKILEEMAERYDYIGLGGMVKKSAKRSDLIEWLDRCFYLTRGRVKFHGFGMTSYPLMLRYPFYSIDSTTWLTGSSFTDVYRFVNGKLVSLRVGRGEISHWNSLYADTDGDRKWKERNTHNAAQFAKAEKFITDAWKERGISWE